MTACCKPKLPVASAVLGVLHDFGTMAANVLEGTGRIAQEALASDPVATA